MIRLEWKVPAVAALSAAVTAVISAVAMLIVFVGPVAPQGTSWAASRPAKAKADEARAPEPVKENPREAATIETKILHVDKYGVYVPSLVFYWDSGMPRQKIDALTRIAQKLRNKGAMITYSKLKGDAKDKRPLVTDIVPLLDSLPAAATNSHSEDKGPVVIYTPYDQADPEYETVAPPEDAETAGPDEEQYATAEPGTKGQVNSSERRPDARDPRAVEDLPSRPAPPLPEGGRQSATDRQSSLDRQPSLDRQSASDRQAALDRQSALDRQGALARPGAEPISKQEVSTLVRRVLDLNSRKDVQRIIPNYADEVDYYDRGRVTREYVRRDLGYYFRNWDSISTELSGDVVMIATDQPAERIVKFVSAYSVRNAKKAVTGKSENIWTVKRIGTDLRITSVRQRVIANNPF